MKFRLKTGVMGVMAFSVFTFVLGSVDVVPAMAGRNHGGMYGGKMGGGFRETREPGAEAFEIISVKQAKDAKDDTFVVLQGYIEKRLGHEEYLFRDETGTIKVEIKDKKFRGMTVYPDDFVQIAGEVDKGFFKEVEIEVKNISKKDLPTGGVMIEEGMVEGKPETTESGEVNK